MFYYFEGAPSVFAYGSPHLCPILPIQSTGLSSCSPILQGPFEDYSPNFWTSLYHILGHVITVISIESIDYTTNIYIYTYIYLYIYIYRYVYFSHIFQLLNLMVFCNVEDPRSNFLDAPRFLQEHPLSSLSELNSLRSQNGPVKFRHPSGMWNSMSPGWWFGTGFFLTFHILGIVTPTDYETTNQSQSFPSG